MKVFFGYEETTRGVTVRVAPSYLAEQSEPEQGRYAWAYHVRIENHGAVPVQLISRHWIITDGRGQVQEVQGPGIVGEQPVIEPGAAFDYVSGCPLTTPSGMMRGSYQMIDADGVQFDAQIPAFSLDSPHMRPTLN